MRSTDVPARDNPFVVDDILIRAGVLATIASLVLLVLVDASLQRVVSLVVSLPILGAGLAALAAGLVLRSRERQALRLLGLVERFPEISVEQLLRGSRMKRKDIERAVATVNERGLHYVVWDRASDTLVDGRLTAGSVVLDDCPECGANVGLSVSLANPASAACPYCRSAVPAAAVDALRRSRLEALDAERAHEREQHARIAAASTTAVAATAIRPLPERRPFRPFLFLALFVIVPPIGILYGLYGVLRGAIRPLR